MKILVVVGTRPEFIKMAPIIAKMQQDSSINLILANAGQHYDYLLSQKVLEDLNLPAPDYSLNIGSGTHSQQVSLALILIENIIVHAKPDIVLSQGDTNTVLATALASSKLQTPHGHVEAGLRSFDKTMPEEINRICADHLSELLFAPTELSYENLKKEGIDAQKIHITGNTIVDTIKLVEKNIDKSNILQELSVSKQYILTTVHRPENVDSKEKLLRILDIISDSGHSIVFPIHPRTKDSLIKFGILNQFKDCENIKIIDPVGYIDMLSLIKNSKLVLTDSGGLQEEACILGTPCITLRKNTERPESVLVGANKLFNLDSASAKQNFLTYLSDLRFNPTKTLCPFGDGTASDKILSIIKNKYDKNN